ncbi:ORF6N domain-containing protein [Bacteroides sp. 519]|uniref:ORF6N domain-containing protein n=1 Tax=Bacteroides sp. 519 TaxID=2302937 RepID=UPI0013D85F25|nr:ORF6N domain-containing protein [Bacteroides sp. 519]NDV58973.1 ORF6N domain-containing protein [Bacteroides sp. 519]
MEIELIRSKIYEIRGYKVMLDFDLAQIYGTETKVLKQSVRRNIRRFPEDFMFELTHDEFNSLRSQIVTSNSRGGIRYMPFAFTEQGVAMLSTVLNSEAAIEINIGIMRTFIAVRQMTSTSPHNEIGLIKQEIKRLEEYIEEVFTDYNDMHEDTRMQLENINETLAELQVQNKRLNKPRTEIKGFRK